MWYTVLHEETHIGGVDLALGSFVAGRMVPLAAYAGIRAITRAATDALLEAGLFGATLPPLPPFPAEVLRLRRSMARAARLRLALHDERGALAPTSFVNLLEPPGGGVIVVTAFAAAEALAGARRRPAPNELRGRS